MSELSERERVLAAVVRRQVAADCTSFVRRLVLITMFVLVLMVVAVFLQSYEGRRDLVATQRNGCIRGKLDRGDNAQGWREAQRARKVTANDMHVAAAERTSARQAANTYGRIAHGLEVRSRIKCSSVFPAPSPWPWG